MPYDFTRMTFNDLVVHFGTVQKASEGIGFTRQTIYDWRDRGIPGVRQLQIQKKARGALKADREVVSNFPALLRASAAPADSASSWLLWVCSPAVWPSAGIFIHAPREAHRDSPLADHAVNA